MTALHKPFEASDLSEGHDLSPNIRERTRTGAYMFQCLSMAPEDFQECKAQTKINFPRWHRSEVLEDQSTQLFLSREIDPQILM